MTGQKTKLTLLVKMSVGITTSMNLIMRGGGACSEVESVLLSIQPKWCELIASGKKTVEIRKTKLKIETPFKCYIYCTKPKTINPHEILEIHSGVKIQKANSKVIGEYVCDKITTYTEKDLFYGMDEINNSDVENSSCVDIDSLLAYKGEKEHIYGWHISDLVIYDKPKELGEFYIVNKTAVKECKHRYRTGQPELCTKNNGWIKGGYICMKTLEAEWCEKCIKNPLKRPPQSWCYVEEQDD